MRCTVALTAAWLLLAGLIGAEEPERDNKKPADSVGPSKVSEQAKRPVQRSELTDTPSQLSRATRPDAGEPPLLRIGRGMRDVQKRLANGDPGSQTRRLQAQIIHDLDRLIEQVKQGGSSRPSSGQPRNTSGGALQRQRRAAQAAQGSNPNQGATSPGPKRPSEAQLEAARQIVRAVWGHLPAKLREEMQQVFSETMLPKYEAMIEQYFLTIAKQNERPR